MQPHTQVQQIKKEAEKFLRCFYPDSQPTILKDRTIKLSKFAKQYKQHISSTYSKEYLERAVVPSFNKLQKFLPDVNLDTISLRNVDQFISSVIIYS